MNLDLSRTEITFLRDIPSNIKIDMDSGWKFNTFYDFSLIEINTYIKSMEDNETYMIVPVFTTSVTTYSAVLNLSSPFLIDNRSNPLLIIDFIANQWKTSGFTNELRIIFLFKLKRVRLIYK